MSLADPVGGAEHRRAVFELNRWLEARPAMQGIEGALASGAQNRARSSSFGAHWAVWLYLPTRVQPDIAVILVDTAICSPKPVHSSIAWSSDGGSIWRCIGRTQPRWMQARHGRLWQPGDVGIGDVHTTRPPADGLREEDSGLLRIETRLRPASGSVNATGSVTRARSR